MYSPIAGRALHAKDLQIQKKRRPLASTQSGRGPADKPVINRSSTAHCAPRLGLNGISFVHASENTYRRVFFGSLVGKMDGCFLAAQTRRLHPALTRLAPPRPDPPRPPRRRAPPSPATPVVCPGFGLDTFGVN